MTRFVKLWDPEINSLGNALLRGNKRILWLTGGYWLASFVLGLGYTEIFGNRGEHFYRGFIVLGAFLAVLTAIALFAIAIRTAYLWTDIRDYSIRVYWSKIFPFKKDIPFGQITRAVLVPEACF